MVNGALGAVAPPATAATAAAAPLRLIRTVLLPGVQGDFDHFTVDLEHNRLFVATEDHATLEVFDLRTLNADELARIAATTDASR